ncbi:MAG: GTPase Era [Ardenticatenia bacterium]|nr:GTPase Era [Ardenticatenia bacterium]
MPRSPRRHAAAPPEAQDAPDAAALEQPLEALETAIAPTDGDAIMAPSPDDLALLGRLFGRGQSVVEGEETEGSRSGFVALIGQPNVGKSTLLNALVGEKVAIVSPRPQTTRRRILGIRTEGPLQAVFIDTPGLHRPVHELGKSMVRAARAGIRDADVVVWVVDASHAPDAADAVTAGRVKRGARPVIVALNKADLLKPEDITARVAAYSALVDGAEWVLTIARTGHNVAILWSAIARLLPAHAALYDEDQLTDQSDRQFAAELIREAALMHLQEEVPHGLSVQIEDWKTREDGLVQIGAKIFVERQGHKAIVIGKGGQMLKTIGTAARKEIERNLDTRVFLELFVTVKPHWRRSSVEVQRLGFD